MNTRNWKETAELVGIAAVVAGLIFVGIQLRQSQAIAASGIYQERTSTSVEAVLTMIQNDKVLGAMLKGRAGRMDEITPDEEFAGRYTVFAITLLWDNAHFQHENGFLSDEGWERVRNDIRTVMRGPFERRVVMQIVADGRVRPPLAALYREIDEELSSADGL